MRLIISDDQSHFIFAPITLTRPLGELRMGLFTSAERWKILLNLSEVHFQTDNTYIQKTIPEFPIKSSDLIVNARIIPSLLHVEEILQLSEGEELWYENNWIAKKGNPKSMVQSSTRPLAILNNRWDLYLLNDIVLRSDFELFTKNRKSTPLSSSNTVIGDASLIFIEEGASVEASILNTKTGPIYIGKNAEIMEGSMVRGPLALLEGAVIKMGAKIYGATTIGPHCKVGGEISNSIFFAYSNKGHDGFIGNAYIGSWCNLGADTNCSNLKNNYGHVKTYCYQTKKMIQTEISFMGLFMGDHSKCAINTMFNTATVVGVSANIFTNGFPPKVVPSFSWGVKGEKFQFNKALEVAEAMMQRRNLTLSQNEIDILSAIYNDNV